MRHFTDDSMPAMRIGLFGGSFDPVHHGHLGVARAAADHLGLNQVRLIPAAQAPLRDASVRADGLHRIQMLRLALVELAEKEGEQRLTVSDIEVNKGGMSYTADTLRTLHSQAPGADFFWILGADQLARLGSWRDPAALAELATWAAYARPSYPWKDAPSPAIPGLKILRIEPKAGLWDMSSSEIRGRIARGANLQDVLSDKVIEYIRENRLYGSH
jgi:nicotinate-nucleotide adenylyltransferase